MSVRNPSGGATIDPARSVAQAMMRGARLRCPTCGEGKVFRAYLKVVPNCDRCGEDLHHERAHDAPPYIVITIVGHIIVTLLLSVELAYQPPIWVHMALWLPLTILLSLALLPPAKGAMVGVQWALRMHGFGGADDEAHLRDGGLRPEARA